MSGEKPSAWRCEHCRKFYPVAIGSWTILVDDVSSRWIFDGAVKRHGRFMRRMVVCPPCKRAIGA